MKRLSLMRHGDARWNDAQTPDFDRPLNRRGNAEVHAMARRLVDLELVPGLVLASPAQRTRETAQILARELALKPRQLRFEEGLYLAPADEVLEMVSHLGPRLTHALVVGHNPGLSELAARLAPAGASTPTLETAALCSLSFRTAGWPDLGGDRATEVLSELPAPTGIFRLFA